ncbi:MULTISPECIES: restriction endonuclease subunit S [Bacteroides]|uniref:restriction endonuclease subunit S n=1 Tax=Bacteroides TaxID=816 RepID=UPI002A7EDC1D|nr:restriction endonuclease subunit S [Bacteroides nordii]
MKQYVVTNNIVHLSSISSYYEKFLATGEVKCIDEEIPFEIPKGWEWTRIGNIFNHTSGKQQCSSNKSGGAPQKFITTSNLYWGHFVLDNVKVMNFTEEEIKSCSATKGDLLVCEGGAGYGRSAIWNEDYDICLQNHVHRLRPCINGICEYVYHFIYLLKESNNLASVGTAMPGLSANRLKGLLLPLPPIKEQQRIVEKLKAIMPIVEKYDKVQTELDELNITINTILKKSILQEAIQGKLVPQIEEDGTAQELLEQIRQEKQQLVKEGKLKKSALNDSTIFRGDDNKYFEKNENTKMDITGEIPFEIPDSWSWVRLNDICSYIQRGKSPKYSLIKKYPVVAQKCNQWSGFSIDKAQFIDPDTLSSYGEERILQNGDLMWNSTGLGTLGRIAIYWQTLNPYELAVADSHVTVIRVMKKFVLPQYLYYYFTSNTVQSVIEEKSDGSTKQKELATATVKNYLVPIPPLMEQSRIISKIKQLASIMSR